MYVLSQQLLVTRAQTMDSGPYTCNPSRGQPVTADVHIITGTFLKLLVNLNISPIITALLNFWYKFITMLFNIFQMNIRLDSMMVKHQVGQASHWMCSHQYSCYFHLLFYKLHYTRFCSSIGLIKYTCSFVQLHPYNIL